MSECIHFHPLIQIIDKEGSTGPGLQPKSFYKGWSLEKVKVKESI